MKPKLGVDLDGVVYSWCHAARSALHIRGIDIEVRECNWWNELKDQISDEDWRWLWGEGSRDMFGSMHSYPGAVPALRRIENDFRIAYVTHRPQRVADLTLTRLAQDKLHPWGVIHCAGESKADVLYDAVAFVEDQPKNAIDIAGSLGVPVFMPRRPYNREVTDDMEIRLEYDIRPYDSWTEVEEWVQEMIK